MSTESTTAKAKRTRKVDQWPKVKPTIKNGRPMFLVDARIGGKGERFFYELKKEAETKADLLRVRRGNEGKVGLSIPERLRVEAMECAARLAPLGTSLTEAVDYFIRHARPAGGEKTVSVVVAEFLKAKKTAGLKKSYLDVQGYVLNVFVKTHGKRLVHELTSAEIDGWLNRDEWTLRTRLNYFRDLRNLFGFAIRKGYCATNPVLSIEQPKPPAKAPGFLTPEEAAAVLTAPATTKLGMQASIAIGLFCGIRSSELEALDWKHVRLDLGTIAVSAESAKMSERRVIEISDNLRAWLEPLAKNSGRVAPEKSFDWRLGQCWRSAGLTAWPKNAMRHSFATYHLAQHRNAPLTADQLGHFGDTRTLVSSYRNVCQPADAARYWAIRPMEGANVLRMKDAA